MIQNNPIIYACVDRGRLHIANQNSEYGTSINSYNNFMTQFFAWLSRKSMVVEVAGKKRSVNIKSHIKFLHHNQLNHVTYKTVRQFNKLESSLAATDVSGWHHNGYMRSHLSFEKTNKLFKSLVKALINRNVETALRKIGNGANIDGHFWVRAGGFGLSFDSVTSGLPKRAVRFIGTHFNPILYAKYHHINDVFHQLFKAGANRTFAGETVDVSRTIIDVERRAYLDSDLWSIHGSRYHRARYTFLPRIRHETIVHYKDQIIPLSQHNLDANLNFVSRNMQR